MSGSKGKERVRTPPPPPVKSHMTIGILRYTATDPLEKQLDPKLGSIASRPSVNYVDDLRNVIRSPPLTEFSGSKHYVDAHVKTCPFW